MPLKGAAESATKHSAGPYESFTEGLRRFVVSSFFFRQPIDQKWHPNLLQMAPNRLEWCLDHLLRHVAPSSPPTKRIPRSGGKRAVGFGGALSQNNVRRVYFGSWKIESIDAQIDSKIAEQVSKNKSKIIRKCSQNDR